MILRTSPASPFGRKVLVGAGLLGLTGEIDVRHADTGDASDDLRRQNPLGKIPTLIAGDLTLYDSPVILEYLDHRAGGGLLPTETQSRYDALTRQALADGIMDASLAVVYEARFRPEEKRHEPWTEYQADKVRRSLAAFETRTSSAPPKDETFDVGDVALACALGYRDLRFAGDDWRAAYPGLANWHAAFEARVPAYGESRVTT